MVIEVEEWEIRDQMEKIIFAIERGYIPLNTDIYETAKKAAVENYK